MEGQDGAETITDIQNYLETFNKEIQGGEQTVQHVTGEYYNFKFLGVFIFVSLCITF